MYFFNSVLYVVGSPIGNFFDFSNRAIFILKKVDFIIAEDSRKIGFLISFFNFKNKIVVVNAVNEKIVCNDLLFYIKNGFSAALVSDSGTPCISDPGQFLIKNAYLNYLRVIPIPGPSVVSTVISIASFSINKFIFEGFLPKKKIYKEILFNKFIYENRTCIFFETGERIIETLFLIKSIINSERTVFIAKDLTKKFEFIFNFKLSDLNYDYISSVNFFTKGEFVILLSPFDEKEIFLNYFNNISLFTYLKNDFFLKKIVFSSYLKISTYVFFD